MGGRWKGCWENHDQRIAAAAGRAVIVLTMSMVVRAGGSILGCLSGWRVGVIDSLGMLGKAWAILSVEGGDIMR
jgi:hypothetical protein